MSHCATASIVPVLWIRWGREQGKLIASPGHEHDSLVVEVDRQLAREDRADLVASVRNSSTSAWAVLPGG